MEKSGEYGGKSLSMSIKWIYIKRELVQKMHGFGYSGLDLFIGLGYIGIFK